METHSSSLAWKIPWTEGPDGLGPCGHTASGMTDQLIIVLKGFSYPEIVKYKFKSLSL